jgi:hypothetical protein
MQDMTTIQRSALFPHPAHQLFEPVDAIGRRARQLYG